MAKKKKTSKGKQAEVEASMPKSGKQPSALLNRKGGARSQYV